MKTEMIKIDRDDMDLREMKRAGEILKKGGLVAFPRRPSMVWVEMRWMRLRHIESMRQRDVRLTIR